MFVPKKFNGITIQVEWLSRRQSKAEQAKLNVCAEEIQRHNHPS
jgi:hypothetical protein